MTRLETYFPVNTHLPPGQPHLEQKYLERVLSLGDFNDKRRWHTPKHKRTRTKHIPNMIRQRIIPSIPRIQMFSYRRLLVTPITHISKAYLPTSISIKEHPQPVPLIHTPKHISFQPPFCSMYTKTPFPPHRVPPQSHGTRILLPSKHVNLPSWTRLHR